MTSQLVHHPLYQQNPSKFLHLEKLWRSDETHVTIYILLNDRSKQILKPKSCCEVRHEATNAKRFNRTSVAFEKLRRSWLLVLETGFAIITWNNPKKIGETLHHQGTNATCQSLGARFSHVTVGSYGGPREIVSNLKTPSKQKGLRKPMTRSFWSVFWCKNR